MDNLDNDTIDCFDLATFDTCLTLFGTASNYTVQQRLAKRRVEVSCHNNSHHGDI